MLFPLPMRYQGKVSSVFAFQNFPQTDMNFTQWPPSLILFSLGDTKLEQLLPTKCLGRPLPPALLALLHPWTPRWSGGLWAFLIILRCQATWILAQEKQGPGVKVSFSSWDLKGSRGVHYTFRLNTPASTLYCTRILNSFWLRYKACFLPGCPGLSFFPLSLVGVQE